MNLIVINKKVEGLNKASCSCGWYKFSTTGLEIDTLGAKHAKEHDVARVVESIEGKIVSYSGRRAQPGRPSGGVNHGGNSEDNR